MDSPLVSIIIPTYNRAHIISRCIDSVLNQTYNNLECIVVDDDSMDETDSLMAAYLKQDKRVQYIKRNRAPKGAPTCRNIGLEASQGEFVIFLDSDDYLLSHCLAIRVREYKENSDCGFLIFPMGIEEKGLITKSNIPKSENYLINFLSAMLPWSIMCPIWKRIFLIELDGFKEGYPRLNDPELMIRALLTDNLCYKVFGDYAIDCLNQPSEKASVEFGDKVYEGLKMFIPDIVSELKDKGKFNAVHLLSGYLHLWFKYIFIPSGSVGIKKSLILIKLFENLNIIGAQTAISLRIRFIVYNFTKRFKFPVERLSEKRLYVKY